MARKRREEESSDGEAWLATYADLVTLLLCFFVLLFASSTLDVQKFQAFISSFPGGSGVMPGGDKMDDLPTLSGDSEDEYTDKELEDLTSIKELIDGYGVEKGISEDIETVIEERGLLVRSLDNVFFDSGKVDVKPEAKAMLDFIGEVIKKEEFSGRQIKVEGHTDSDKITSASNKYRDNWELSAIRATNVLRYLVEAQGIEGNRVSISGYGDNRPLVPNDTPANKAINRRVDLIILRSSVSELEPDGEIKP